MEQRLRSLFITAEMAPFARTGGLGDVAGALPPVLAALGHDVRVVMPLYQTVRDSAFPLTELVTDLQVPLVIGNRTARVWQSHVPRTNASPGNVPVYFIEQDEYFARPGLYGDESGDYPDNATRFIFFCRAALALTERLQWFPHVFHCHDWHAALVPAYVRFLPGLPAQLSTAATVYTIHNFAYQGVFPSWAFTFTGLPLSLFQSEGMEFFGLVNFMKAGVLYADRLTTVSPTYAEEICTPEFGFGLDGVVRSRRSVLEGILNGADYDLWNPATDPILAARYSANDLSGKAMCKAALLQIYGLPEDLTTPLVGLISRLVDQKGIDLLTAAFSALLGLNARFVILGSGEAHYEELLSGLAQMYPDRVGVRIGFDSALAHQIQAGSDLLLMPSRYEPCGLNQIYGLRYGTLPIARATGGLKDTIAPFEPATRQGTGFLFHEPRAEALVAAVRAAIGMFTDQDVWQQGVKNAMAQDFSWMRSAARYLGLYRRAVVQRQRPVPSSITFGPSGWRALLAEEFTHDRVAVVARAMVDHLQDERVLAPHVLIAHDTRFLGQKFAETVAETCTAAGVRVSVATTPLPTPVVAFEVLHRRLAGAVTITAGGNSALWNGMKIASAWGGPALPDTTRAIAQRATILLANGHIARLTAEEARSAGLWIDEEIGATYRQALTRLVDVECIAHQRSDMSVAVDLLWGATQGFLDQLLQEWGVIGPVFHQGGDPYFGRGRPEPVPESMTELIALLRRGSYTLGVGCDCDGDRFGICDRDGTFFVPNFILALLLDYLVTYRGLTGRAGRTVATSHLIDAVARHHGLELVETPVGFTYLGEMIARDELLLAGEESGGLSIRGHVPERDGILACLLTVEMVARTGKSLTELLADLFARVGPRHPARQDIPLTPAQQERLDKALLSPPERLAGLSVDRLVTLDGLKLCLRGGAWFLVRVSGPEPVMRLYAEAETAETTRALLAEGRHVFLS